MEVLEFFQCYYKMCASYVNGCDGCEAQGIDCELTTSEPEKLVAAVERWAKAHPEEAERERQKAEHSEESSDLHAIIDALEDRFEKLDDKVSYEALSFRALIKQNQDDHIHLADRIAALEKDTVESMNEPKRTNKDVLLAAFPNARMDDNGVPDACPIRLYAHYNCDKFENCLRCRRTHWLAEVEK